MTIVGFYFDKISVEKLAQPKGQIKIKNDIKINGVEKESNQILKEDKGDLIKISFEFSTEYEPKIGILSLKGHISYLADQKESKEILNGWKKDKRLPSDLTMRVLNFLFTKANIMALNLTQEVGLPPHIQLPALKPKTDVGNYVG